jgi:hypothetical protein
MMQTVSAMEAIQMLTGAYRPELAGDVIHLVNAIANAQGYDDKDLKETVDGILEKCKVKIDWSRR